MKLSKNFAKFYVITKVKHLDSSNAWSQVAKELKWNK